MAEISRIMQFNGEGLKTPTEVLRARLDEKNSVYYLSPVNKQERRREPTASMLVTAADEHVDAMMQVAQGRRGIDVWDGTVHPRVELRVGNHEEVAPKHVALLAHAALWDGLKMHEFSYVHALRGDPQAELEVVITDDLAERAGLYRDTMEMRDTKVLRRVGARGIEIVGGFIGNAWDVAGQARAMVDEASVYQGREEPGDGTDHLSRGLSRPWRERHSERVVQLEADE